MGLDNPSHIAILVVLLLLVFGAKRLPEIGRSLGEGMRGFKETIGGASASQPESLSPPPAPAPPVPPAPPAATEQPPAPAPAPDPR
jgi:sec-independent protein translocase protein TatA